MKVIRVAICGFVGVLLLPACKKYLNKQSDAQLQVPNTLADYRAILDGNGNTNGSTPGLGPIGTADYYVTPTAQSGLDMLSLGLATWRPELYQGNTDLSWTLPYTVVYNCNVVLAGLPNLPGRSGYNIPDQAEYNSIDGGALFIRSLVFYHLEETFGQPWTANSSSTDPGIPLRLSSDPLKVVPRSTVQAVFNQIVGDLSLAARLLPAELQDSNRNRPCRSAAYGLLAKVWLTQQNYVKAQLYADSSLLFYNQLVDYNRMDSTAARPFPQAGNAEVLFQSYAMYYPIQYLRTTLVDSLLYRSYDPNDLRRVMFFQKSGTGYSFKGGYTGLIYLFNGMAVDDILLVRAECRARNGDAGGALNDLDTLLAHRWRKGTFQPYTLTETKAEQVLPLVLTERRKETIFREGRWADLRRLNQNVTTADTLKRTINGQPFVLFPGNLHYTWLIPQKEINLGNVEQNPG